MPAATTKERDELPAIARNFPTTAIFLVSVLGLFLELLLIRWIGTEVRIFAYLQNTVLVVCFLGLGLGCFSAKRPIEMRNLLAPLFVLTLFLALAPTRTALGWTSQMLSALSDFVIWGREINKQPLETILLVVVGLTMTFCLMLLLCLMFVPLGRILGRLMDEHPKIIAAYSANVAGSLIGIWCFVLLSAWDGTPVVWFLVLAALLVPFLIGYGQRSLLPVGTVVATVALAWVASHDTGSMETQWSPYQKLVLSEVAQTEKSIGEYLVTVNNAGYQVMIDLAPENIQAHPERYNPDHQGLSQYDLPIAVRGKTGKVLVVGAGSGNDVAGVLRGGAEHVTAVEIDPAIIDMGKRFHPEKPYQSERVTVVNDDARAFFATAKDKYDLILFGLLDSHTMTAMTNVRLDHYVYTKQSLEQAKRLLAPGGTVFLSFSAQTPYIADRMAGVLREVFGEDPICFRVPESTYGWGGVAYVAGNLDGVRQQIAGNPRLSAAIAAWQQENPIELQYATEITTDDWPYLYLRDRSVPTLFYLLAGLVFALLLVSKKLLGIPQLVATWRGAHAHFFFLGAAFMLLEVQNISKAAVVLGNTWSVNAVIISGVLIMVLLANLVVARWPNLPMTPVYLLLCGSCLGLYFVDISILGQFTGVTRSLLVGGLTTLPMFFSGIVFIRSFAAYPHKDEALGANLIGSLVGGVLQSVTFIIGMKALLLIVTAFYLLAILTRPRTQRLNAPAPLPLHVGLEARGQS